MNRFLFIIAALAGCVTADVDSTGPATDDDVPAAPTTPPPVTDGSGSIVGADLAPPGHTWRILDNVKYEVQSTGYWCGPAATDMALSARMTPPGQQRLATQLGTDSDGTDHIGLVEDVLNLNLGASWYVSRVMPNDPPTPAQRELLWSDLVRAINSGFPLVANIVAPAGNHPPGYPNYTIFHYITLAGYNPETREVYVNDSANFGGNQKYWLSFNQIATLIPPKGYTALAACTREVVVGKIGEKFDALGSCGGALGAPITVERATPDGIGRFSVFERGSIYWTPTLGAHEVRGRIRDAWAAQGWEVGPLGYPTSDEYAEGDGRRSDFQHGHIHWSAATNTTTIGQ